ncbi:hypothetical protein L1Z01_21075, partial [Acinetobacter baumannii]|nr:hypothetical protein [Acinetobacter baumannii]MCF4453234.1 hypothetical protein [Acinetobacter baumannii]MCF4490910.1 hypothetical protein [Acinetobacter baumannii]MCF4531980.1 hypothetical protein [Acinetobacter baumannii]MCF4540048.1 hypothetical protein [Acinetobacter baumannii]
MSLIRTRKKIVSSAIASSLSMIATTAMAQEAVSQLPTIHTKATQEESLKVDQSANSKFVAPLKDTPKSVSILSQKLIKDSVHDKFHRTLILSGFCLLKIAKISL